MLYNYTRGRFLENRRESDKVRKSTREDGRTISTLSRVDGEEREREIARLLSGSVITDAALANARELLKED